MYAYFFTPSKQDIELLVEVEELAWALPGENMEASRKKIQARVASFSEGITLATLDGEAAGSQYSFRFGWDGDIVTLQSWDYHTAYGWTNKVHDASGNTGFMVGVGVVPKFRGIPVEHNLRWKSEMRISELLIARTLDSLFNYGVEKVIANARIPDFHTRPDMSVDEYCQLRRPDGKLYDRVLRFHERMGAKIIKPVPYSLEDPQSLNAGCWVLYQYRFED